ncbi:HNH endonuclease [Elizabethkingia anophelis]|uniref:HNH endonuclease n=1 Tax=Elizabethkingia anophelis TaxID=1117645 RepID=UPI000C9A0D96|nr:HNH endonuclease [Elizabethkingia anophelis]MCT3758860.1 HNH endonuclease [Elizabethkingia anophelis]MCT3972548.1 HNH endonuclease [Elizabethkingia anophelis]MCT4001023.1 HNH endonuclease [Elizabethkingia anophelis]MCT4014914.1 HNH endonuclease [Elizabethkingia anophelis]MCT4018603.1 HNH endonuclease [Elizabethkingia anophelis]
MADEQYLTEKHYLVCSKGIAPKKMKVTSQNFVIFSGDKAATELDTMKGNNFTCVGSTAFAAGAIAGIACCLIPGPGWVMALIIAAAIAAAIAIGYLKCKAAAGSRVWTQTAEKFAIEGNKTLTLSSIMVCQAEGGTITPKETMWEAWGSAALTNLGHVANFAFGFLAGRGMGAIAGEGAAAAAAAEGGGMAALRAGGQAAVRSFTNTAKKELIEQFTFKGFKNASFFCKVMRGLGIGGAYYDQYNIWSSDKDTLDKLKESGVSLIMGIFAAKGATTVCFPSGTKVHAEKGLVNIEDLNVGDNVLTYNLETKRPEYKPILIKHERFTQQMLTLELPTGEFLQVTPEHRFFCNDEWIEARDLKAGDLLHLKGGHYTTVISIEVLPHYEKVYNFDILDNENYYVTEDGILVHNGYKYNQDGSLKTRNQSLKDQTHPKTGVPFKENTIVVDGKNVKGVFPVFDAKYKTILPDDLLKASDPKQFKSCTKKLAEDIEKNPILGKRFTEQQLKDIKAGNPRPEGLTWHHNEKKGVMELVDQEIHAKTGHTGGNNIWGGDIR